MIFPIFSKKLSTSDLICNYLITKKRTPILFVFFSLPVDNLSRGTIFSTPIVQILTKRTKENLSEYIKESSRLNTATMLV